jgi:Protein of unknown function (DUF3073)
MGRGRAKAKQTKVARELKYNSPTTDLEALQRELSGDSRVDHDVDRGDNSRDGTDTDEPYTDEYDEYRR